MQTPLCCRAYGMVLVYYRLPSGPCHSHAPLLRNSNFQYQGPLTWIGMRFRTVFEGACGGDALSTFSMRRGSPAHTKFVWNLCEMYGRDIPNRQQQKGKRQFRKGRICDDGRFQECIQVVRYRFCSLKVSEGGRTEGLCLSAPHAAIHLPVLGNTASVIPLSPSPGSAWAGSPGTRAAHGAHGMRNARMAPTSRLPWLKE